MLWATNKYSSQRIVLRSADLRAERKAQPPVGWASWKTAKTLLDPRHVARLRALLTIDDLELDLIAFLQTLIAIVIDRAVMHEHIRITIVTAYKAKAFRVIEPLYGPFHSHFLLPPGRAQQHPHPEDAGLELRQSG
jgi:hypothetical protein